MKTKFIYFVLLIIMLFLPSCNHTSPDNSMYPDILLVKDGKEFPNFVYDRQDTQENHCNHEKTSYHSDTDGHQLFCDLCKTPLEPLQSHTRSTYRLQTTEPLDSTIIIRIYVSSCSVCNAPVNFLLSSTLYPEYRGEPAA